MKGASKHLQVVFDTNILISALGFQGAVRRVWGLAEEGKFAVFVSPFILGEFERNLLRLKLHPNKVAILVGAVKNTAHIIHPTSIVSVIKSDKTDNRILECAVDAKADVIVTGNMKDIRPLGAYKGIAIMTPREFLDKFFPAE
jgi:putative PIN family toxin of toxin-antitoxin system